MSCFARNHDARGVGATHFRWVAVFWCANSYVAFGPGSASVGTFIAQDYISMTSAALTGRILSVTAGVTLTTASIHAPRVVSLASTQPSYTTSFNMMRAARFAILAGTALTNVGPSIITGDVGSYPAAMAAGEPNSATLNGINFNALAQSASAQADLPTIYAAMISHLPAAKAIASSLDGAILMPGAYTCGTHCSLGAVLTLDAQGDPNAVFQFITEG